MIVHCKECDKRFKIDEGKLVKERTLFNCPACKNKLEVVKPRQNGKSTSTGAIISTLSTGDSAGSGSYHKDKPQNQVSAESNLKNIEYTRKVKILTVLIGLALILLSVFAVLSYMDGDKIGALVNFAVLIVFLAGFLLLRLKGNLVFASYILTLVLALQFLTDFSADSNSAMWSYTIPILSFFLLGMRPGAILSAFYLISVAYLMFLQFPENYAIDFKSRFIAIYLSLTFFTYIYEKSRITAQNLMETAQRNLEKEKDKLAESDRALQYFKSLVEGKTITLVEPGKS